MTNFNKNQTIQTDKLDKLDNFKLLCSLQKARGKHTQLVSLLIPSKGNDEDVSNI